MYALFRSVFTLSFVVGISWFTKDVVIELIEGNIIALFYPSAFIITMLFCNEFVDRLKMNKLYSSDANN
ncbi:hypothetical protein [Alteromonas gracilis]|uniref:hypothetical protein n=1 Tax=Alteromonas gracilis TaxID=1479524 RepID=UPI003736BABB